MNNMKQLLTFVKKIQNLYPRKILRGNSQEQMLRRLHALFWSGWHFVTYFAYSLTFRIR